MRARASRWIIWLAGSLLATGCAPPPASLPPPSVHADGQVLWQIVNGRCVPDMRAHGKPDPCAEVDIADGAERGHVVLKDKSGRSQYLVMPTALVPGIEDARLLSPTAPDYFTSAWRVRGLVAQQLGVSLDREDVGVAVNSIYGRSQDLLHLHVDCLRTDVRDAVRAALPTIGRQWSHRTLILVGHGYRAIRVDGDDRVAANPFRLVSEGLRVPKGEMGGWTIVLAGARFSGGKPGFVLLAARADPATGYKASGEDLQDHDCADRGATAAPLSCFQPR